MSRTFKIVIWSISATIVVAMIVYAVSYTLLLNSFKHFAGRDPSDSVYLQHVADRVSFGTVQCDNTLQWDTIQHRINKFFIANPDMVAPDSLGIEIILCEGCAVIEKAIYFKKDPTEIYIANFDLSSANHIDEIYQLSNGEFVNLKTDTLKATEKERIKSRLQTEVLDKIDWNIEGIKF